MASFNHHELDTILGLQLTVAWAGEKAAEPERLGWWDTDVIDEGGGGDLFVRLLPKTARWAGLEVAREAAIRADAAARTRLAEPDRAITLFHFGFELDEALQDRLDHHKHHAHEPSTVLGAGWGAGEGWSEDAFATFLRDLAKPSVTDSPGGRLLKHPGQTLREVACSLAAALLPLGGAYPLAFAEVSLSEMSPS